MGQELSAERGPSDTPSVTVLQTAVPIREKGKEKRSVCHRGWRGLRAGRCCRETRDTGGAMVTGKGTGAGARYDGNSRYFVTASYAQFTKSYHEIPKGPILDERIKLWTYTQ